MLLISEEDREGSREKPLVRDLVVHCGEAERQSQALAPSALQLPGQKGAQETWIMEKNLSEDGQSLEHQQGGRSGVKA